MMAAAGVYDTGKYLTADTGAEPTIALGDVVLFADAGGIKRHGTVTKLGALVGDTQEIEVTYLAPCDATGTWAVRTVAVDYTALTHVSAATVSKPEGFALRQTAGTESLG